MNKNEMLVALLVRDDCNDPQLIGARARAKALAEGKDFNPSERRDRRGRWTNDGVGVMGKPSYQDFPPAEDPAKHAPLHDLAASGKFGYGSDIYGPRGRETYGSGEPHLEEETWQQIRRAKGKPNEPITIYRAVPEHASDINPGDFVTLSRAEAENFTVMLGGRVVKKQVRAKDVRAVSDYTHEWGYFPGVHG